MGDIEGFALATTPIPHPLLVWNKPKKKQNNKNANERKCDGIF